jgi:hypothetical protein
MSPPAVRPRINPPQQRDLSKNSAASEGRTGSKYLRTKSSSRRPVEILDDDDEFFPTRKAKRSSSQPTKKTTIEVQIPPYRQVGSAIGYQGSSNKETSLPKHKIWGNDDSKAPAEVSGYQGTANKVPTLSKNKMRGKSDSQPSAEISGYQSTSNQEPSRPRNKIWGNGDSQPPAEVSGYQGTSSREPSLPKNRLWGNSDPQPPEEASGYQGTTKKEFSRPKIRTGTSGNSQPPAEPTRFEKYFPLAQNRTPTDNPNGTYSAHPLRGGDQKMANSGLGTEIRSSVTCSSVSGANDEDSVEEEIVTAAAQATLNNIRPIRTVPRPNILYEGHREPADGESSDEESEELESEESEASNVEPKDSKPRHAGFPPVEELPDWFPENIKQMYQVDRHGGALSYRASSFSLSNVTSNK